MCAKELLAESERAVSATVPHRRGLRQLAQPMVGIRGYRKWGRVPRPLGPNNLGKALLACVAKLKELRERRDSAENDNDNREQEVEGKANRRSLGDDENACEEGRKPTGKRTQKYEIPASKVNNQGFSPPNEDVERPKKTTAQKQAKLPTPSESSPKGSQTSHSSKDSSGLRVLLVEDNALNIRLLGAFLTRYGCGDIQQAENGIIAVEAVKRRLEGFDIIFMGTFSRQS